MRKILILCVLLWAGPALANDAEKAAVAYDKALGSAASWNDLRPHLSAATLTTLDSLPATTQLKAIGLFKMLMAAASPNPTVTSKVQKDTATVELKVVKNENGSKMTETRTYKLVKEGGKWKVDFREPLESMKKG